MWTAVAVTAVGLGIVHGVQLYAVPTEPRPLNKPLANMPLQFGGWEGTEVVPDERVQVALGADDSVSRYYVNPAGERISVHCAAWLGPDEWTPHPPPLCYTAAGNTIQTQRGTTLGASPREVTAESFVAERDGRKTEVIFWYRLGDATYGSRDQARKARRDLWGKPVWPPLIKVLIQADGTWNDPRPGMEELALAIDAWTRGL